MGSTVRMEIYDADREIGEKNDGFLSTNVSNKFKYCTHLIF